MLNFYLISHCLFFLFLSVIQLFLSFHIITWKVTLIFKNSSCATNQVCSITVADMTGMLLVLDC